MSTSSANLPPKATSTSTSQKIAEKKEPVADDRVISTVKRPPMRPIAPSLMYPDPSTNFSFQWLVYINTIGNPNVPDLEIIRKHLFDEGSIAKPELIKLIKDVTQLMSKLLKTITIFVESEPNVIRMTEPVVIIGDIHG